MSKTAVCLFAGAGGFALGMEQAGVEPILLVEQNPKACKTLKANRPDWNVVQGQCWSVDYAPYAGATVMTAGLPCQPYSLLGLKGGVKQDNGNAIMQLVRAVKVVKPEYLFVENVLTFYPSGYGYLADLIRPLGYLLTHDRVDGWHFGMPQARKRLLMTFVRNDKPYDLLHELPTVGRQERKVLNDALEGAAKQPCATYSVRKQEVINLVPMGGDWRDLPMDVLRRFTSERVLQGLLHEGMYYGYLRRLDGRKPCPSITAKGHYANYPCYCHPYENRPLSIDECRRLQGFPDDWQFEGGIVAIYRQIGNAVPPLFARLLVEHRMQ